MTNKWIWDTELYNNLVLWIFKKVGTSDYRIFEISPRKNNVRELVDFIREEVDEMIGFNSLQFDYPILHFLLVNLKDKRENALGRDLVYTLKTFASSIVFEAQNGNPWNVIVQKPLRRQIDLFKIHHFDNKNKSASLKLLQFNLRMINVKELPYPMDSLLTNEQIEEVIQYCKNDVDSTEIVYNKTIDLIEMRDELGQLYGMDMTNYNDPKIGEKIISSIVKRKLGVDNLGQTYRSQINLNEIIFPYIQFQTTPLQKILEWFKSQTITSTKGVFSELPFEKLASLEGYYRRKVKKKCQENLNIVYKDFMFVFGLGGIHGCCESGIYESDNEYAIIDIDVNKSCVLTLLTVWKAKEKSMLISSQALKFKEGSETIENTVNKLEVSRVGIKNSEKQGCSHIILN
jgi:hypothetical protein